MPISATAPITGPIDLGPTHFQFPDDEFSFAKATERCFGVGKCRSLGARIMCPSFQATREEFDNTRGRSRLLFEMVRGDALTHGWDEPAIAEALDLCLQCKGCKHDCPVNVDMATYKAEFLSHYHKKHWRPRSAYSMGLIWLWLRLARFAPGLFNQAVNAPGIANISRWIAGITMRRDPPALAAESFQDWFARRDRTPRARSVPPARHPLARHLEQLLPPGHRQGRRRRAGRRRLSGDCAAGTPLLRPSALRLRHA